MSKQKVYSKYGDKVKLPDVWPLQQREPKMNTRKGMLKRYLDGYCDLTPYKEQKIL